MPRPTLTIAALSTPLTISLGAIECCANAKSLFVQTELTPCIKPLIERGISFVTMDDLYMSAEDFDALEAFVADRLIGALAHGDAVYAVPGSGLYFSGLADRIKASGADVVTLAGVSYAYAAAGSVNLCFDTAVIATSTSLPKEPDITVHLFIEELDTRFRASEVKLALSEYYPDEHMVTLCHMASSGAYKTKAIPLYELDRCDDFNAATVLIVPPAAYSARHSFGALVDLMQSLREKCPWDKKQTHETIRKNLIEECYEVLDAIDRRDDDGLIEELGDVLLQCVFHAQIASEQGRFTIRDVTTTIVEKLIYRHPHIFGSVEADTPEQVLKNWERLKMKEKRFETQSEVLSHVPGNLPALMRANKVQKKAADVGFDWDNAGDALLKLKEETTELENAIKGDGNEGEEMGDLLFAGVNVCRLLGYDPEELLREATEKFISRFGRMEAIAAKNGHFLYDLDIIELDKLWNFAKSMEIT